MVGAAKDGAYRLSVKKRGANQNSLPDLVTAAPCSASASIAGSADRLPGRPRRTTRIPPPAIRGSKKRQE